MNRNGYRSIVLYGSDLAERARVGEAPPADLTSLLPSGGGSGGYVGFAGPEGAHLLAAAVQVREKSGKALGWLAVLFDGGRDLWPLLLRESVQTRSAESLLVKRKGEDLVFLSPLRHRAEGEDGAAKIAVSGHESFGEFLDYRGVPVLAVTRYLAGPGWGLVVKVDRAEGLEPLGKDAIWALLVFASVVLAGIAVVRAVRRTERWRSAEAAALQAERYHLVVEEARDAILWIRPSDGRILEANRAAEVLWGYSRAELLAKSVVDLGSPEETAAFEWAAAAARKEGVLYRTRNVRKGGERFPLEVSARSVDLAGEQVVISVGRDVSESVAAYDRIAFLNRLLRTITGVGQTLVKERDVSRLLQRICQIMVEDADFVMAWVGALDAESGQIVPRAAAGKVEGYFEEVRVAAADVPEGRGPIGTAYRERKTVVVQDWATDDRVSLWREAGQKRGYRASAACPILRGEATAGVLTLYAGQPWVLSPEVIGLLEEMAGDIAFALDVAEGDEQRRHAEEQVRTLNAELEQRVRDRTAELEAKSRELEAKSKELETFSYSVSHDLRAPLRAIDGYSRLLEEQIEGRLNEKEKRLLDQVRIQAGRMGRLIAGLLAFSRVGRLSLKPERTDVAQLVWAILDELLPKPERTSTELRVGDLPTVVADPILLRQVFENLLSNAIKFSSSSERREIEVDGWREGARTSYRVRDNGVGFDPRYAHKLFSVFERLHGREFEGTGIGLALVRRIVEQHGGRVEATSVPGEGAAFTISFPDRDAP